MGFSFICNLVGMTTKIFPDYERLSRATADLIADYISQKPKALVCIASGHTPVGVFQNLMKDVQSGKLNISQCTFLSLDEWVGIDPNDSGSCLSMLKRDFFAPLNIPAKQTEFFDVQVNDLQKECDRINSLIEKNGGLDIMLVGVGTNGHIGMNEPGTSFDSYAHIGDLAEETKTVGQKYFSKQTKLSRGMTLGLKHLQEAKLPIVMANGEKKAAIMGKAFSQKPTEQIPVTIVQLMERGYIMIDEAAATKQMG
jgi:glucosamine-6-phosphate isomerase